MGILVEYRDVTAQLAAEGELKRHEQLYRGFVENATGIIFTTGADNRFITANHTWLELLGVSIQELRDRTLSELVHPEQQARTLETREERWSQGINAPPRRTNKLFVTRRMTDETWWIESARTGGYLAAVRHRGVVTVDQSQRGTGHGIAATPDRVDRRSPTERVATVGATSVAG